MSSFSKVFWSFLSSFPLPHPHGHFSLDLSCNVFPLDLGVGQSSFGSFAVAVGNSSVWEQFGHTPQEVALPVPPPPRMGGLSRGPAEARGGRERGRLAPQGVTQPLWLVFLCLTPPSCVPLVLFSVLVPLSPLLNGMKTQSTGQDPLESQSNIAPRRGGLWALFIETSLRGCGPSRKRREGAVWVGRGPRGAGWVAGVRSGGSTALLAAAAVDPGAGGGVPRGSGWGAGRAGRDARSKCNDFSVRLAKQGQSRERSGRGTCPAGRVRPFRRLQSTSGATGAVAPGRERGPRAPPGRGRKLQASWARAEVAGTGWGEAGEGRRGHRECGMLGEEKPTKNVYGGNELFFLFCFCFH